MRRFTDQTGIDTQPSAEAYAAALTTILEVVDRQSAQQNLQTGGNLETSLPVR
jgi:hypothetical protein